ncbi:ParA family protein [Myxococcota bacterium]
MTRIIAITNEKGGTGKTTTAVNLAHGLARADRRTLLIDLDPQGNATQHLNADATPGAYHLFTNEGEPSRCIHKARECLDLVPSNKNLFAAQMHINSQPGRELILRSKLLSIAGGYDFVLVDCAPSLSVLGHNALAFCREVLVPVAMDYLSLSGLESVERTVATISRALGHDVQITGVIPTFLDARLSASRDVMAQIERKFGPRILPAIRVNSKLREAPKQGQTVFEYAPDSRGALDYDTLTQRIITMEENDDGNKTPP